MSAFADMLRFETQAQKEGLRFILGVDEAGRGPLAGPVVAAAVCLKEYNFKNAINDSKKMTPAAREEAFYEIYDKAWVGIGVINEQVIDFVNILNAAHLAMDMAVEGLLIRMPKEIVAQKNFHAQIVMLIDGHICLTQLPYQHRAIIDGDAQSLSIACASIIAKVYRDRVMNMYDKVFGQYGFAKHKGYPTEEHRQAIQKHGPSMIHRKSFKGVA